MKFYRYKYKILKNNYDTNIYIRNNLDIIKYIIDFSSLLISIKEHDSYDKFNVDNIYLVDDNSKYYILSLFNTKYFFISIPWKFHITNNSCHIFYYSQELKMVDLQILKYMLDIIHSTNYKEESVVINLNNAIEKFKQEHANDEIPYHLENIDLDNIFINLLRYNFYYARYDYDEKNASDMHPLNHIDLGLENTIKLGLRDKINPSDFINFNLNKEIFYIEKGATYEQ